MAKSSPILVSGLNHSFGKGSLRKQILFDISTEIPQGEIVIVTGPSGSGKTTLLTLVGALRSTQDGSVRVLGQELKGAKPAVLEKVRGQIGFIAVFYPWALSHCQRPQTDLEGTQSSGFTGRKVYRGRYDQHQDRYGGPLLEGTFRKFLSGSY